MRVLKKLTSGVIITTLIVANLSFLPNVTFAKETNDVNLKNNTRLNVSAEFLDYLGNKEEYGDVIPRSYTVSPSKNSEALNPFFMMYKLGAASDPSYTLQSIISNNLVIRDQKSTNSCWAFSGIGMIEAALGLRNLRDDDSSNDSKTYDFSERHLIYSVTDTFTDGHNPFADNIPAIAGGNMDYVVDYLANGLGLVAENEMRFKNSEAPISSSEVAGKTPLTTLYDTKIFESKPGNITDSERNAMKNEMKAFIEAYGPIYATIRADSRKSNHIDLEKGSIYYTGDIINGQKVLQTADHAVVIVGWDDNYSKNNFVETPAGNGAWIVKNSWGTDGKVSYDDAVIMIKQQFIADGTINKEYPDYISDEEILSAAGITDTQGVSFKDIIIYYMENEVGYQYIESEDAFQGSPNGIDGFMYVSYYDQRVYGGLVGVQKVTDTVDFSKAYSYSETPFLGTMSPSPDLFPGESTTPYYLGNKFQKQGNEKEYIHQVSLCVGDSCNVKVYVNPINDGLADDQLVQVELVDGLSRDVEPGYHVFELKNPIEITGSQFSVAVRVDAHKKDPTIPVEPKIIINQQSFAGLTPEEQEAIQGMHDMWEENNIQTGVTKFTYGDINFSADNWYDSSEPIEQNGYSFMANNTLRAYTTNNNLSHLDHIGITRDPNKIEYTAGENFDKSGMQVVAYYADNEGNIIESHEIFDYEIVDGNNLREGQDHVTVRYQNEEQIQEITVTGEGPAPSTSPQPSSSTEPQPSQSTAPQPSQSTGPQPSQSTAPNPSQSTAPNPSQSTAPNPSQSTVPQPSQSTAPSPSQSTNPQPSQSTVPNPSQSTVPQPSQSTVPNPSQSTAPSPSQSTAPNPSASIKPTEPSPSASENPNVDDGKPVSCNFDRATVRTKDIDTANKGSITVVVENIEISPLNDTYEYYFYLSKSPNETSSSIRKWVKIEGRPQSTDHIEFTIAKEDVENYSDLLANQNIYLYVEEVVTRGGNQAVAQSKALKLKAKVEEEPEVKPTENPDDDPTTAKGKYPYTGAIKVIIALTVLIGVEVLFYKKYKKLDNDIRGK